MARGEADSSMPILIGRLQGQIEALTATVAAMADQQAETAKESREGRSKIYARLEETTRDLADIKRRMAEVEPVMNDVKRWRERAIGARMTVWAAWAAAGGGVMYLVSPLLKKLGLAGG